MPTRYKVALVAVAVLVCLLIGLIINLVVVGFRRGRSQELAMQMIAEWGEE